MHGKEQGIQVSKYLSKLAKNSENHFLSDFLKEVESGKYKEPIDKARDALKNHYKNQYDQIKNDLPAYTLSATFNERRVLAEMVSYNNLIVLDFDHIPADHIEEMKRLISEDINTLAVFLSPSGLGLKVLIRHDAPVEHHKEAFLQLAEKYEKLLGMETDPSGKDVTRLCFVSYDPGLYYNEDSETFKVDLARRSSDKRVKKKVQENTEESDVTKILDSILKFLYQHGKSITYQYHDWYRVSRIISSLGLSDESGLDYFIRFSECDPDKFDEATCIKQYEASTRDNDGSITIATLIYLAEQQGYRKPKSKPKQVNYDVFWNYNPTKKGTFVDIDKYAYREFLVRNGYRLHIIGQSNKIIKITDNVLEEVNIFHIKKFVMDYIDNLPSILPDNIEKENLIRELINNKSLFTKDYFEFLDNNIGTIHKDTSTNTYLYFSNGFVDVSVESVSLRPYKELDGNIWKNQIINRDFHILDPAQDCEFNKFISNISGDNMDRQFSLISTIGYLLSRYKDSTNAKVIIFVDEQISMDNEAHGGTGKTMIGMAISKLRNMVSIDGKNFVWNRFSFEVVELDTNLIFFDDVKANFVFENLYSTTTTGIDVEKKNKSRFNIPFKDAPKIAISSNYMIKGTGGFTEERRKHTIEISDHYGPHLSPKDEFGHSFFDDWDAEEWNRFDNFMVNAAQTFLQHGLIQYEHINLPERELMSRTNPDFITYMESQNFAINKDYNIKIYLDDFIETYPDFSKLSQRTFNKWLVLYFKHMEWTIYEYDRTTKDPTCKKKGYFHNRDGKQYFRRLT